MREVEREKEKGRRNLTLSLMRARVRAGEKDSLPPLRVPTPKRRIFLLPPSPYTLTRVSVGEVKEGKEIKENERGEEKMRE